MTSLQARCTQCVPEPNFITTTATNIVRLPLAFVRSGYVRLQDGRAWDVGNEASARSRAANSAAYARYLNSDPTSVNPSYTSHRFYGFPLC